MKKQVLINMLLFGIIMSGSVTWESDLIFSHKFHHEDVGAECATCHDAALTSTSGTDDLLPEMQTCYNCHDEEMDCAGCHQQPDEPVLLPRIANYSKKFSHKSHVDQGIACLNCHVDVDQKLRVNGTIHLPVMDDCMSCHQTPRELDGCYLCHEENEHLKPADHTNTWAISHGMYAESASRNCNSCHLESYCADCHQGENLFNQSHPAGFIATHGISYMVRESDCASCHSGKDYCIECHMEVNRVLPVNHSMPDWPGYGHAEAARSDFDNCTVCHTSGDLLCGQCHN